MWRVGSEVVGLEAEEDGGEVVDAEPLGDELREAMHQILGDDIDGLYTATNPARALQAAASTWANDLKPSTAALAA